MASACETMRAWLALRICNGELTVRGRRAQLGTVRGQRLVSYHVPPSKPLFIRTVPQHAHIHRPTRPPQSPPPTRRLRTVWDGGVKGLRGTVGRWGHVWSARTGWTRVQLESATKSQSKKASTTDLTRRTPRPRPSSSRAPCTRLFICLLVASNQ